MNPTKLWVLILCVVLALLGLAFHSSLAVLAGLLMFTAFVAIPARYFE